MLFADASRGRPYSKDPAVIEFAGRYLMYYSLPPFHDGREDDGWRIGVASSTDLDSWQRIGEIPPLSPCDRKGLCAPGAIVLGGHVHLFYQTYGNQASDAICHAVSADGLHFIPNSTNPVFAPTGNWTCGRAIDADVIAHGGRLFLYFSTRDLTMRIQMAGVATASLSSDFSRDTWTQQCDAPILYPELPWEGECIEAAALCRHDGRFYMFYAGAYNNWPQQIGCAVSHDGIGWERISAQPVLPSGEEGTWNSSESGHPYVFEAADGTHHLFFQGNNDQGRTWYLSRKVIRWEDGVPRVG